MLLLKTIMAALIRNNIKNRLITKEKMISYETKKAFKIKKEMMIKMKRNRRQARALA